MPEDVGFDRPHKDGEYMPINIRFPNCIVEVLKLVNVHEGDRYWEISHSTLDAVVVEIWEEKGWSLKDMELFVVLSLQNMRTDV